MNATLERVKLPGYKRESVVYVRKLQGKTAGKTKYVRKGGEWVTLTRAMKVKKGGQGQANIMICKAACEALITGNKRRWNYTDPLIAENQCGDRLTLKYLNALDDYGRSKFPDYNPNWLKSYSDVFSVTGLHIKSNLERVAKEERH